MVHLTDARLLLLADAAQRGDRLLPLASRRLHGAVAYRTVQPLVAAGCVKILDAPKGLGGVPHPEAYLARDGRHYVYRITPNGLKAIGIEPEYSDIDPDGICSGPEELAALYHAEGVPMPRCLVELAQGGMTGAAEEAVAASPGEVPVAEPDRGKEGLAAGTGRGGRRVAPEAGAAPSLSGKAQMLAMLGSDEGTTVPEISTATGWQSHTVRAALSRLRKAGYCIERMGGDDAASRYRLAPGNSGQAERDRTGRAITPPAVVISADRAEREDADDPRRVGSQGYGSHREG